MGLRVSPLPIRAEGQPDLVAFNVLIRDAPWVAGLHQDPTVGGLDMFKSRSRQGLTAGKKICEA